MLEEIKIENLIYNVKGKQVMLDSDLAKLYGCKNGTKDINKAVNRNIESFNRIMEKTTTNMIQKISPIFAINPLISKEM